MIEQIMNWRLALPAIAAGIVTYKPELLSAHPITALVGAAVIVYFLGDIAKWVMIGGGAYIAYVIYSTGAFP